MDLETRRAIDRLTRELATLSTEVKQLRAGGRKMQAPHTSIENTSLPAYDVDGNERQRIGRQRDGRYAVVETNGPAPPAPSAGSLFAMPGGFRVSYDGTFAGGEPRPSDTARVVVHVSLTDGFTPTADTRDAAIEDPEGGAVNFLTDDLVSHYVRLVAVTTSGVESEPSEQRSVTPLEAGGGVTTFYQETEPPDPDQGDLWVDKADRDGDGNPDNIMARWDGAGWVTVRDEGINQAIQDAAAAQTDAADAIDAAADAQATADAKVTTFYQEAEPTATGTGDMWVKDSTGQLHRWDGSAWQPFQDEEIAQAINDAANAQNTADSKIVSYFQDAEPDPSQLDLTVGDIWYKTNAGNRQHWWGGSSWSEAPVGTAAISPGAVTTEVLAGGSVDNPALADEAVDDRVLRSLIALTSRLVAGDPTGARVELNGSGLEVYDASGNRTVFLQGADGSASFTGSVTGSTVTGSTVRTSDSGVRIVLNESTNQIECYDDSNNIIGIIEPDTSFGGLTVRGQDPSSGEIIEQHYGSFDAQLRIGDSSGSVLASSGIAYDTEEGYYVTAEPAFRVGGGFLPFIHGIDYGYTVQATDSNGQIAIPHGLPSTPTMVQLTLRAADGATYAQHIPAQTDLIDIWVQCRNVNDGGPLGGGNTTGVYWLAIA